MTNTETPLDDFAAQQYIGDRLLLAGWHARAIPHPDRPATSWVLLAPSRRVRLIMTSRPDAARIELAAAHLPSSRFTHPLWTLVADAAPPNIVLAAARAAALHPEASPGSTRRATVKALRERGWTCPANLLLGRFTATVTLTGSDARTQLAWAASIRSRPGGWTLTGPDTAVRADATTPAEVITALASACTSTIPTKE